MDKDEIIEMAKQAGFSLGHNVTDEYANKLKAFAKLVAAKEREACTAHAITAAEKAIDVAMKLEREACLKICEAQASTNYWEGADVCAEVIRARGEA